MSMQAFTDFLVLAGAGTMCYFLFRLIVFLGGESVTTWGDVLFDLKLNRERKRNKGVVKGYESEYSDYDWLLKLNRIVVFDDDSLYHIYELLDYDAIRSDKAFKLQYFKVLKNGAKEVDQFNPDSDYLDTNYKVARDVIPSRELTMDEQEKLVESLFDMYQLTQEHGDRFELDKWLDYYHKSNMNEKRRGNTESVKKLDAVRHQLDEDYHDHQTAIEQANAEIDKLISQAQSGLDVK